MESLKWGINYVSHDTGVACVDNDGKVVFAVSEERLSRVKKDDSFPSKSIDLTKLSYNISGKIYVPRLKYIPLRLRGFILSLNSVYNKKSTNVMNMWIHKSKTLIKNQLKAAKSKVNYPFMKKTINVDHHNAHAASAYYPSGFDNAVVLTLDGVGDFYSGGLYCGEGNSLVRKKKYFIHEAPFALDYQFVTALLGFKPNRHEGKITGLAAFGKYNENCINHMKNFLNKIWSKNNDIPELKNLGSKHWCNSLYLSTTPEGIEITKSFRKKYFSEFSDADLAFAIQYITEEEVIKLIQKEVDNIKDKNICLAGGLFANVKLNQKIKELGFKNIFIQPAMGDDGISYGAVFWELGKKGLKPKRFENVYFGPEYSKEEIKSVLDKYHLKYEYYEEGIEEKIAKLIHKGNIIARFDGRMEYGPRALGNRSILYHTTDKSINDWLNKNLRRTEFMPFAPVTLEEEAHKCYKNLNGSDYAAQFMTITFDCTDYMIKNSPAVVHIDGTARPQLINSRINPSYYKIVKEYFKLTGIPSLVNTSFNMHEEPIVCTPEDAVRSFLEGRINYLAIGKFLVKGENLKIKK